MHRSAALTSFVDAAAEAFSVSARGADSRRVVVEVFAALQSPAAAGVAAGARLPVCAHLPAALAVATDEPVLRRLVDRFAELEPQLAWRRRADTGGASANYPDRHGNAMVLGPGGLEERDDAWLGATLMAPHVRYPDHDHAPEEVYVVMSDGAFRQADDAWFVPGVGGSFYNRPGIRHVMRAHDAPLLAFWVLQPADPA